MQISEQCCLKYLRSKLSLEAENHGYWRTTWPSTLQELLLAEVGSAHDSQGRQQRYNTSGRQQRSAAQSTCDVVNLCQAPRPLECVVRASVVSGVSRHKTAREHAGSLLSDVRFQDVGFLNSVGTNGLGEAKRDALTPHASHQQIEGTIQTWRPWGVSRCAPSCFCPEWTASAAAC